MLFKIDNNIYSSSLIKTSQLQNQYDTDIIDNILLFIQLVNTHPSLINQSSRCEEWLESISASGLEISPASVSAVSSEGSFWGGSKVESLKLLQLTNSITAGIINSLYKFVNNKILWIWKTSVDQIDTLGF